MTRAQWTRKHVAAHLSGLVVTVARCHRDRPHKARGLCRACYRRWLTAQHRIARIAEAAA